MESRSCTLYFPNSSFDLVSMVAKELLPGYKWSYERTDDFTQAILTKKRSIFKKKQCLRLSFQERTSSNDTNSPLSARFQTLKNQFSKLSTIDPKIIAYFDYQFDILNQEMVIENIENAYKDYIALINALKSSPNALLFALPDSNLGNHKAQGFLNHNFQLILDMNGKTALDWKNVHWETTEAPIEQRVFDLDINPLTTTTVLPANRENTSSFEDEKITSERFKKSAKIAERITAIALTNLVAFGNLSQEKALNYAEKHKILPLLNEVELEFIQHPTKSARLRESWKCERAWVLFWVLGMVNNISDPEVLADLTQIEEQNYPIGGNLKPSEFIQRSYNIRSKAEIEDLFERYSHLLEQMAKENNTTSNSRMSVIYERHEALKWVLNDVFATKEILDTTSVQE